MALVRDSRPRLERRTSRGRSAWGALVLALVVLVPGACQPRRESPPPAATPGRAAEERVPREPDALDAAMLGAFQNRHPRVRDVELMEILARPSAPPGSGFAVLASSWEAPAAGDTAGRTLIGVFEVDAELARVLRVFDVFPRPADSVTVRFEPHSAETLRVVMETAGGAPRRRAFLWPQ